MKSRFDRRDLLKGLLAVPGAAAFNVLSPAAAHAEPMATPINLNVVLHGTFAVEFDTDQKRVFLRIPSVDGHKYKAGVAGFASDLNPGSFSINLPGINNMALPLELQDATRTDLVVVRRKANKFTLNASNPALITFDLPFPVSIKCGRAEEFIESGTFFDDPNVLLQIPPSKVPLCLVMQYKIEEANIPPLPGNPVTVLNHRNWHVYAEPAPGAVMVLKLLSQLQIFAQSQNDTGLNQLSAQIRNLVIKNKNFSHVLDSKHPATAFDQITALYLGLDGLELSKAALIENNLADSPVHKPPDLGPGEQSSLEELGPAVAAPVSEGGSHVGTCAGLIIVN
jgi:hypothetical protein